MDWTEIILGIIGLVGAVLTGILIPYFKNKLSKEQLETIDYWIRIACAAMETKYQGESMGAVKKAEVLNFLRDMGLKFDEEIVSTKIDALCRELTAEGVIN